MNKMKKMVVILCVALVTMLLMATTAFAQTTVTTEEELSATLQAGGEVALGDDIVINSMITIPSGVEVTLDLNGHNITVADSTGDHIYAIDNNGTLTLKDSVGTGSISARGMYNHGTMTIESGNYVGLDSTGGAPVFNYGKVTINGGVFNGSAYTLNNQSGSEMVINNATVKGTGGIYSNGVTLVINGGTFEATGSGKHNLYMYNSDVTINGGKFHHSGTTSNVYPAGTTSVVTIKGGEFTVADGYYLIDSTDTPTLNIENGTFTGMARFNGSMATTITGGTFDFYSGTYLATNATMTISGGTFTSDSSKTFAEKYLAEDYKLDDNGTVIIKYVVKVNGTGYATFEEALTAASALIGDVTVEIYDKVTLSTSLAGSYDSITFVGKDTDAEIYLDVQGYITATGKKVAFDSLTLSKSEGGFITDAGFMNVAFGVYDVVSVDYTGCTFANGAYASSGVVTFEGCTFYRSHNKYGLWAYGNADITVNNCVFDDYRGIKMYAEGAAKVTDLTVTNTDFSAVNDKPAIVLTYGESVTLLGNKYSSTGVFELDKDGAPNGTAIEADIADISCMNDNYADCGVIVDGKIYVTLADAVAANAVTGDSTVTLMYDSTEVIELPEGTTLDKNGHTADSVTVAEVKPVNVSTYEELVAALANGKSVIFNNDIVATGAVSVSGSELEIDLNGKTLTLTVGGNYFKADANVIIKNGTVTITGCVASGDCIVGIGDYSTVGTLTLDNVDVVGDGYSSAYAVFYVYGTSTLNIVNGSSVNLANDNAAYSDGTHSGGFIKCNSTVNGKVNISNTEVTLTNAQIGILDGTVVLDTVKLTISGGDNAINQSALTIKNSEITISDCNGRAITPCYGDVIIESSKLTLSKCTEGEIRFKKNVTVTIDENSTIEECTIYADSLATSAKINDVTVVGTETSMAKVTVSEGTVTIKEQPKGNTPHGYTTATTIWGQTWGNATQSYVIKIYAADGTLMGTTTLNTNLDVPMDGDVEVTWHISLDPASDTDEYWIQEWFVAPSIDVRPTKAVLCIDGVDVSEGTIKLNGPDDLNMIYAAEVDENGKITEYCTIDSFVSKIGDLKDRRILVLRDVTVSTAKIRCVELISGVEGGVTITDTDYENWIDFDFVTVGQGVTVNVGNPYSGDSENVILGTLIAEEIYYHSANAITTIKDGGKVVVNGSVILRYNDSPNAGIYIYGDGNDATIEFDCDYYIGAYSGTFYAENANIETGYFLLKNSYDDSTYADIAMTLNNSSLKVAGTTDGQDSFIIDDQASVTLINGASISDVREFNILADTKLTLSIDESSKISATNVSVAQGVPFEASKNEDGTYSVAVKTYTLEDIFVFLGYSKREDDNSITAGFTIDHEALAIYKAQNGNVSIDFGAVFAIGSIANGSYEKSLSAYKSTNNYNVILTNVSDAETTVVLSMYVTVGNEKYYVTENAVVTDPSQVGGITFTTAPKKEDE